MKKSQLILGAAVAGFVLAGCSSMGGGSSESTSGDSMMVKGECHGVNSCKGTGDCGGKGHSCAGKNSCKGQGWKKMSEADCADKGGKFKAM